MIEYTAKRVCIPKRLTVEQIREAARKFAEMYVAEEREKAMSESTAVPTEANK